MKSKVRMIVRQYPKDTDTGFTAKEIRQNIQTIYQDYECPKCGFTISVANAKSEYCPKC